MTRIESLIDLRPGDIMFGPIGGLVGVGVGLGQLALGEGFRLGRLSIRHVGIVVEASVKHEGAMVREQDGRYRPATADEDVEMLEPSIYPHGVLTAPRLVQAMPGGAEEIDVKQQTHWTDQHAYVRLPEDYPGQAADAAAVARLMVREGVAYSPASYLALALRRFGVSTPRVDAWINRRRTPVPFSFPYWENDADSGSIALPVEAICSVLVDQAWSLTGKRVVIGTVPQVVTPGMMAGQLWSRGLDPAGGVVWGGKALL